MNRHRALIEVLLEKFRENTITREEFDQLSEIVNDPATEGEIKYWMQEHWQDMEPLYDDSAPEEKEADEHFEELRKKIQDKDREA